VKKQGILHPALSHLLASTGHTDYFTVTDRGFPVPDGPERIDLALVDDLPTVLDVVKAVMAEWEIDRVVITREMTEASPQRIDELRELLGDVPLEIVTHLELKSLAQSGKATVRTGDSCPYANLILVSG
jgi:D-ribose pyranase